MIHTKIEETTVLGKKVNKVVTLVHNYDLSSDKCTIGFTLRYRDPLRESPAIPDTIQLSDTWDLPSDVVGAWSGSNNFLADKLCEHLGFTVVAHGSTDMELEY
jgi:hypothetical protein